MGDFVECQIGAERPASASVQQSAMLKVRVEAQLGQCLEIVKAEVGVAFCKRERYFYQNISHSGKYLF